MIHNSEEFKIQPILRESSKSLSLSAQNYSHSAHGNACCQSNQTKNHEPKVILTANKNVLFWGSHKQNPAKVAIELPKILTELAVLEHKKWHFRASRFENFLGLEGGMAP